MSFPDKAQRKKCWDARDAYWKCLDKYAPAYAPSSGEEGPKECAKLRKLFESGCPGKWVQHFDRKRAYEQFKEKLYSGDDPLKEQTDTK